MVLNKMKNTKQSGFTIVELLIVIVVIGILAAITIVAYSGITNRAKTTQAQTNAVSVQKVAEAFNADNGRYPGTLAEFSSALAVTAKLPSGLTVTGTVLASGTSTSIRYEYCGAAATPGVTGALGGRITYWDYSTGAASATFIYVGSGVVTPSVTPCVAYVAAA